MNDAAVELLTWPSRIDSKPGDVDRSSRYAPAASRPGAGDQTIEYVDPALTDDGAKRIDGAPGAVQVPVVNETIGDDTATCVHGVCAATRQKYFVAGSSEATLCRVATRFDAKSGGSA